ncbi:hypothetical protein [Pyrococcus abyssi]|nr:hypothetical protein [Pyrococcus abyssi]
MDVNIATIEDVRKLFPRLSENTVRKVLSTLVRLYRLKRGRKL